MGRNAGAKTHPKKTKRSRGNDGEGEKYLLVSCHTSSCTKERTLCMSPAGVDTRRLTVDATIENDGDERKMKMRNDNI
jgi:hypothetical protein